MKELLEYYHKNKATIKSRLSEFKSLENKDYYKEYLFCTLTPQSNAKRCWSAAQEILTLKNPTQKQISVILKSRVRFHNNKSKYIVENLKVWNEIKDLLNNKTGIELRNTISEKTNGYGLKEASHFLRNIGKSDNKLAILDRHILRNMQKNKIIDSDKIKSKKHYLELEKKFIEFAKQLNIPADELDLVFWSMQTGEVFK